MASAAGKTITAYLKRIIGSPVGEIISLAKSDVSIGRTKKSDICIHDPNISRSHCILNYSTDGWFITDLGGINGTYLDNDKLTPQIPYPLRDGLGIYLGPPSDAPVAFVFIKNKVYEIPKKEDDDKEQVEEKVQTKKESLNDDNENLSPSTQPNLKRRANADSHSSISKRHAPSTSSHQPASSQSSFDGQDSDNLSDTSLCSLDSLKTRIRKMNSFKKKKQFSSTARDNTATTSAPPSLRPSSPIFDCIPSTSSERQGPSWPGAVERLGLITKITPGAFKELESLFHEARDSLAEHLNRGDDSESLLTDSLLSANTGPNPLPQSVEKDLPSGAKAEYEAILLDKSLRKKKKMKNLNEQLQKAHAQLLKENSEQKKKLKKLEASTSKKEPSEKLGDMLEEELICNICTEVFIKATTLGCSHTFCEYCITEWKKKQKRCPMCREVIISETRVLIMDNFIDKVVEKLGKDYQEKRKDVIATREAAKANAKVKKTKRRKKSSRSRPARRSAIIPPIRVRRDNHNDMRQWRLNLLNEVPFHVGESIELLEMSSDLSDIEEHCVFCGEFGHDTSNCPRLY